MIYQDFKIQEKFNKYCNIYPELRQFDSYTYRNKIIQYVEEKGYNYYDIIKLT